MEEEAEAEDQDAEAKRDRERERERGQEKKNTISCFPMTPKVPNPLKEQHTHTPDSPSYPHSTARP
jgi:hypothetical protein